MRCENEEDKLELTRVAGLCIAGRACGSPSPPGAAANEPTTWE